jgi:putative oxidoreductase
MKWAVLIVRTIVGLAFAASSVTFFLNMVPAPDDLSDDIKAYWGVMGPSKYMTVVKVLELAGGLLLLTGVFVPVGITLLTPIIVNILLFELLIAKQPGPGIVLTLLSAVLIYGYWPYFRSVFTPRARIGGGV